MPYIFIGFIFGFTIPFLARRFAKFMPATLAYALYRIFHFNARVSKQKRLNNAKYKKLSTRYLMRSIGWGIITAAVVFLASLSLPQKEMPWISFLIIILLILTEIDKRMQLLPDLLTIPLLIAGFTYASFVENALGETITDSVQNSALGAIFGYTIPVIASLFLIKKHPDVFGGGDIKLLSALGAWFGVINIPIIILLSCIIFAIDCFIKKQRLGAFGPSIVLAALINLFLL